MRPLTASSIVVLASISLAAPPETDYAARVVGAQAAELQFSDGVASWRCAHGTCRGKARARARPDEICADLSARVGPVNAFGDAGGAFQFQSAALFACNAEGSRRRQDGREAAPAAPSDLAPTR